MERLPLKRVVGLVAMATTLVVIPTSIRLVLDSSKSREAIAILRTPKAFELRGTNILDATMYDIEQGPVGESNKGVQLVAIVSRQEDVDSVLGVWDAVKDESLLRRAGVSALLCRVGEQRAAKPTPSDVAVSRVRNPEDFSIRTGIRVLPFTLIIASGGHVLAAGAGLPDAAFIRHAAERFIRDGASAAIEFRHVTAEMNAALIGIETLFASGSGSQ